MKKAKLKKKIDLLKIEVAFLNQQIFILRGSDIKREAMIKAGRKIQEELENQLFFGNGKD